MATKKRKPEERNVPTVAAAKRLFHEEGRIEVDDNATVSRGEPDTDGGAYVQAWVWVPNEALVVKRRGK